MHTYIHTYNKYFIIPKISKCWVSIQPTPMMLVFNSTNSYDDRLYFNTIIITLVTTMVFVLGQEVFFDPFLWSAVEDVALA